MSAVVPASDRHLAYRPEVDGLRALAILPVLAYHLRVPSVSGGYVGVDVFFVISGYLITKLIITELENTGRFSFATFYVRRLRRLMPAFLTTAALSLMVGFLLLSPGWFRQLGNSALAATFSVSNFYFWSKTSYFDTLANTKPLLHTWSLAVEEQFYLLWPAIAFLIFTRIGRQHLPAFLVVTGIASIAIAEYLLTRDRAAAFYLLPPRAAELGLGGLTVWLERRQLASPARATALAAAGVAMIFLAIFAYRDETPFPGLAALLPCLGAALFLHSARQGPVAALFRMAAPVWIGRISYSLYLVHWPLIVFYQAWTFDTLSLAEQAGLALLSIALGWAQFRFVEERFRYVRAASWKPAAFVSALAAAAALVAGLGAGVALAKGLPGRIPPARHERSVNEWREIERQAYCSHWKEGLDRTLFTCQNERGKAKDLFIWGDSHARHLVAGISEAFPDYNIYTLYLSGCAPQLGFAGYAARGGDGNRGACLRRNRRALDYFAAHPGSRLIISNSKVATPEVIAAATRQILDRLQEAGTQVALLGDFIRPGVSLADCIQVPRWLVSDARIARRCRGMQAAAARELAYNDALARLLPELINPNEVQCPGGSCQFLLNGDLLYMDDHHFNVPGSIYFVARIRDRLPF